MCLAVSKASHCYESGGKLKRKLKKQTTQTPQKKALEPLISPCWWRFVRPGRWCAVHCIQGGLAVSSAGGSTFPADHKAVFLDFFFCSVPAGFVFLLPLPMVLCSERGQNTLSCGCCDLPAYATSPERVHLLIAAEMGPFSSCVVLR